jgi:hypothetical protein
VEFDPYRNDPQRWGVSLAQAAEILLPCLDAAGARHVVEIGAFAGDLTRVLVAWAEGAQAGIAAIDPAPQDELVALADAHPGLGLIRETSLASLPRIPLPDAVIIDGDHNYYTVSGELSRIAARTGDGELPLLLFHDVSWPHGRRDAYFTPEEIPEEHRQPMTEGASLFPGVEATRTGGLPYRFAAEREGGPRNGVLTAVEDFVGPRDDVQMAIVPVFFGLGVVWRRNAPWAERLAELLRPWDRNPLLERLEENRVLQLAAAHFHMVRGSQLEERNQRLDALLTRMLDSSAFGLAERLSRARQRIGIASEQSAISKDAVRRALAD